MADSSQQFSPSVEQNTPGWSGPQGMQVAASVHWAALKFPT